MEIYKFKCWCEKAASGIIFPPDRERVYRELMDHMEDHCDALMEQGMDKDAAQQAAVEAMGDPWPIAKQLAAIHRPFWGYFLRATRVLLVLLALCALVLFLPFAYNNGYYQPEYSRYDPYEDVSISDEVGVTTRMFYGEPGQTIQCDGYTLTLTRAAWHHTVFADTEPRQLDTFAFEITVFNPRPWAGPPDFKDWFWAEDSLGNHYYAMWENAYSGEPNIVGNYYHAAPLTYTLNMRMSPFCSQEAEWIDIHYDRDGRNIRFRIDLTGGAQA